MPIRNIPGATMQKKHFRFQMQKKIKGLQFGIGLETTSSEGILGIGYNRNEVQVEWLGKDPYPNIVDLMVAQGYIQSRAYSLWLNDLGSNTGEILFGGIDTSKYHGKLHTVPIDKRKGNQNATDFMITLTGLSLTNNAGQSMNLTDKTFGTPVLLDSGTTYSYIPPDVYDILASEVGLQYVSSTSIVLCSLKDYNGTVNFEFSGYQIQVPFSELVIDAFDTNGNPITFQDGEQLCFFGIFPESTSDGSYVLGDTFLRSAYVVYDLDKNEISLANTNFNVTESHIMEIGTTVPDAVGVENPVTMEFTGTIKAHGNPTLASTVLSTSTQTASSVAATLLTPAVGGVIAAWLMVWSLLA